MPHTQRAHVAREEGGWESERSRAERGRGEGERREKKREKNKALLLRFSQAIPPLARKSKGAQRGVRHAGVAQGRSRGEEEK